MSIGGMVGGSHFADSPVVITIGGLSFDKNTTFRQVTLEATISFDGISRTYPFSAEVGSETSIDFDISSALRAALCQYNFAAEVSAAEAAISGGSSSVQRSPASYTLSAYASYMLDGKMYTSETLSSNGGNGAIGAWSEVERHLGTSQNMGDALHTGTTKPGSDVERVGADSVLSTVGIYNGAAVQSYSNASSKSSDVFTVNNHTVLRDASQKYIDFLFVNRYGCVESASAISRESMSYDVNVDAQTLVTGPSFAPNRSTTSYAKPTQASWKLSSGWQTREWLAWWASDFLLARKAWIRVGARFLPITLKPEKTSVEIYDRSKQEVHSVDFTATLALTGKV